MLIIKKNNSLEGLININIPLSFEFKKKYNLNNIYIDNIIYIKDNIYIVTLKNITDYFYLIKIIGNETKILKLEGNIINANIINNYIYIQAKNKETTIYVVEEDNFIIKNTFNFNQKNISIYNIKEYLVLSYEIKVSIIYKDKLITNDFYDYIRILPGYGFIGYSNTEKQYYFFNYYGKRIKLNYDLELGNTEKNIEIVEKNTNKFKFGKNNNYIYLYFETGYNKYLLVIDLENNEIKIIDEIIKDGLFFKELGNNNFVYLNKDNKLVEVYNGKLIKYDYKVINANTYKDYIFILTSKNIIVLKNKNIIFKKDIEIEENDNIKYTIITNNNSIFISNNIICKENGYIEIKNYIIALFQILKDDVKSIFFEDGINYFMNIPYIIQKENKTYLYNIIKNTYISEITIGKETYNIVDIVKNSKIYLIDDNIIFSGLNMKTYIYSMKKEKIINIFKFVIDDIENGYYLVRTKDGKVNYLKNDFNLVFNPLNLSADK